MAIVSTILPERVSLARSPVRVTLESDRPAEPVFTNTLRLQVTGSPTVGQTIRIRYGDVDESFEVLTVSDGSGNTLSAQGSLTLSQYANLLAAELSGNYDLFMAFSITTTINVAGNFINLDPRADLAQTWDVDNNLTNVSDAIFLGSSSAYQPNPRVVLVVETLEPESRRLVHSLPLLASQVPVTFDIQSDFELNPCPPPSNTIGNAGSYFTECAGNWARYRLYWGERFGSPQQSSRLDTDNQIRYAVFAGQDYFNQYGPFWSYFAENGKFLTTAPRTQTVTAEQPIWLYWIGRAASPRTVRIAGNFTRRSGATGTFTRGFFSEKFGIPLIIKAGLTQLNLPDTASDPIVSYRVWVADGAAQVLSEVFTFQITGACAEFNRYFLFANSLGGCDTVRATGKHETTLSVSSQEGRRYLEPSDLERGEDFQYGRKSRAVFEGSVGYKTASYLTYLQDMLNAPAAWLVDVENARLNPILIAPGDFRLMKDGDDLHTLKFRYSFAWEDAHAGIRDDGSRIIVAQTPEPDVQ
jgi:hypothetical protein